MPDAAQLTFEGLSRTKRHHARVSRVAHAPRPAALAGTLESR